MTRVDFHFNAPDKLHYGCRLLRKIHRAGQRAVVYAPPVEIAALDTGLWTLSPLDFIPHVAATDPLATVPPHLLCSHPVGTPPPQGVPRSRPTSHGAGGRRALRPRPRDPGRAGAAPLRPRVQPNRRR